MKVAFLTLGCKVNFYETEQMMEQFQSLGFDVVDFQEKADVYIVNTCTVTNMADRKSRQMLHRAKKKNPDSLVVAVGCYVESGEAKLEEDSAVDAFFSNREKEHMAERFVEQFHLTPKETQTMGSRHVEHERTRAYLKIQDGCNQFCSYCIIPYARGRVRSRKMEEVLEEITNLTKHGCQEFVITGIHVTSYGKDLGDITLIDLLEEIAKIPEVKRIRLGSLEPGFITKDTLDRLSKMESFCPHFHLSLQSGCDSVLKRMNRRYDTAEYEAGCDLLRKYFTHPAITTDVIVGFPGETEEEFKITEEYLKKIHFYEMHIFKYSVREGTKAAVMPDQVPEQKKTERSNILLSLEKKMSEEFRNYYAGKEKTALLEEELVVDGKTYFTGYTKEYVKVAFETEENMTNQFVTGKIKGKLKDDIYLLVEF